MFYDLSRFTCEGLAQVCQHLSFRVTHLVKFSTNRIADVDISPRNLSNINTHFAYLTSTSYLYLLLLLAITGAVN